jgi:topoisomerase-4 subunit A
VLDRLHVLEGRALVLLNIDKVIRIIRQADDPKADLIKAFKLSVRQAEDILEIRLRQLAKLEAIKIEQEMKALRAEQSKLEKLLDKPAALRTLLISELREDAKKFGDARRTLIERAEVAEVEVPVVDEPLTVILSKKGWIRARQGHGIEVASITFKEGDGLLAMQECRSIDSVTFIASHGRVYTVPAASLPGGRGDGVPITSLIELGLGARVVGMVCGQPAHKLLLTTADGYGLICSPSNLNARNKAGKQFVNLNEGSELLKPHAFDPQTAKALAAVSQHGRLLVFLIDEMKELAGGGRGVIVMGLDADEKLTGAVVLSGEELVVSGTGRGGKLSEQRLSAKQLNEFVGKRARKGKQIARNFVPIALSVVV